MLSNDTKDHCFGVPGLSRIGERRGLEVPPWDLRRPLGLSNLVGLPPLTEIRFFAREVSFRSFSP